MYSNMHSSPKDFIHHKIMFISITDIESKSMAIEVIHYVKTTYFTSVSHKCLEAMLSVQVPELNEGVLRTEKCFQSLR